MPNKNNKALGRGLNALFSDAEVIANDESVAELELTKIRPNPYQPRQKFDRNALKDLAKSIDKSGVFQPIIVRQPKQTEDRYEIIAGERRFRASKLAEKVTIPAIIRDFSESEMMEIAVMENLQREDLTPLEEAEAYNSLMERLHLTQTEVSNRLGKSRPYIANYLRLLGLPDTVKQSLQAGNLSMAQARTLLSLKDKSKLIALSQRVVKEHLTVRQLEEIVSRLNGEAPAKKKARSKRKSPYIRASEEQLQERFGTAVSIQSKTGKKNQGKIEIEYLSDDDLTRILQILNINLD